MKTHIFFIQDKEDILALPDEDKQFYLALGIDISEYTDEGIEKDFDNIEEFGDFVKQIGEDGVMVSFTENGFCIDIFAG